MNLARAIVSTLIPLTLFIQSKPAAAELARVHLVSKSPGRGAPASFFNSGGPIAPIGDASVARDGQLVVFSLTPAAEDRNWLRGSDSSPLVGKTNIYLHNRKIDRTILISRGLDGEVGNGNSVMPSISADGKFVAFASDSTNLVAGVEPANMQIFLANLEDGSLEHLDMGVAGGPDATVAQPSLSANGRFVAFASNATNLSELSDRRFDQVYVHDRKNSRTRLISAGIDQTTANGGSVYPQISSNGTCILFQTLASNVHENGPGVLVFSRRTGEMSFVQQRGPASISGDCKHVAFGGLDLMPDDNDGYNDVYVQNLETGEVEQIDVNDDGEPSNHFSFVGYKPFISGDGRYVSFTSSSWNLVNGDLPSEWADVIDPPFPGGRTYDVFIRDRTLKKTYCLSLSVEGRPLNQNSGGPWDGDVFAPGSTNHAPSISADGSAVSFVSAGSSMPGISIDESVYHQVYVATNRAQPIEKVLDASDQVIDTVQARGWKFYRVDGRDFSRLSVELDEVDGNVDLYVNEEIEPKLNRFVCRSTRRSTSKDQCDAYNFSLSPTTWIVGVRARGRDANFRLTTELTHAWPPGQPPKLMSGTLRTFSAETFPGRSDNYAAWVRVGHRLNSTLIVADGGRAKLLVNKDVTPDTLEDCAGAAPEKSIRRCNTDFSRQRKLWFISVRGMNPRAEYRLRLRTQPR